MKPRDPNRPKHRRRPPTPSRPKAIARSPSPVSSTQPPPPATHWGDVAEWYDALVGEEGSEYQRKVVLPGAIRLLGAQPNDHVLDIACGQGVFCRMLARHQVRTLGIDAAEDLVRLARDRNPQLPPDTVRPVYRTADVRDLSFLPENEFAAAACLLAIQNINPIAPVFAGVARALRPMGRFVIVMMHPCFRGPKETSWGWDDRQQVQYRRVDRYLLPRKAPIVTHPGKGQDYTWTFHKPIEAYAKALAGARLLIDAIEEWPSHKTSTSGPRAAAENVARNEIPMFLAIRAVKIPSVDQGERHEEQVQPTNGVNDAIRPS